MVVIDYAYTGVLTSFMTVPKYEKIVETLEELAKGDRLRLTIEMRSFMTTDVLVVF